MSQIDCWDPLLLQAQIRELKEEKAEMIKHRELLEKYLKSVIAEEEAENKKLKAEIKKLKDDSDDADRYWRCREDCGGAHHEPDEDSVEPYRDDEGLNKEDTEDLLIHFGYGEEFAEV
tara:strand:+ start:156 stop:509 length:354 start_codon:yes stop_codon:yes gene_type:complete